MIHRQDIDSTSAFITVVLSRDEIKSKLDSELKRFRQKANIKGFRPGQVPMDLVRKMYGQGLMVEVFNDLVSKELFDYLKESDLEILGQPIATEDQQRYTFNINNIEPEYSVKYEIGFVGAFELQGLDSSQTFEYLTISNLDELAAEDFKATLLQVGPKINPEDDIQEKDFISIAAKELQGDEPKEDLWETEIKVLVESILDETVKSQVLTMKKGDVIRLNVRNLENLSEEGVRKYLLGIPEDDPRTFNDWFEGPIIEVNRRVPAELNSEFFMNYFGQEDLDEAGARDIIKNSIWGEYSAYSDALLMRTIQDRLIEVNPIPLPEDFLKRWMFQNNDGKVSLEEIQRELPEFITSLRWSVVRGQIIERFGIEVTEEEIFEDYENRVIQYFSKNKLNLPYELIESSVRRLMTNKEDVEKTAREIEAGKILNAVRQVVTVQEKSVPFQEFMQILQQASQKEESVQPELAAEATEVQAPE